MPGLNQWPLFPGGGVVRVDVLLICVEHWSGRLVSDLGHPVGLPRPSAASPPTACCSPMPTAQPRFCIQARRELMTETFSRTHGARTFDQERLRMECRPTLQETFRDAGY